MKTFFIINPSSGRNRRRPWLAPMIREFAAGRIEDAAVALTEAPGHATELARDAVAAGCELVVAVGGDGTMNEVAQALTGTPAALALVPCGSGNGLALHLGLPRTLRGALELVSRTDHRIEAIDTGEANGWSFFNAMGIGLDAEVSRRFNGRDRRGLSAYLRTVAGLLRTLPRERCTIVAGERRTTLDILLLTVANSDQYGNCARIAPGACVDDGLLDLVAIRPGGLLRLASLVPRLFLGTLDRHPRVVRMRGAGFRIQRAAAGILHTDGETHATGPEIVVRVRPRSLRVLVPATARTASPPIPLSPAGFALQFP